MDKTIFLLIALSFFACTAPATHDDVIDLVSAAQAPICINDLFDSIRFVKLETNDKYPVSDQSDAFLSKKYVIVVDRMAQTVYLFDRNTGKYIRNIGKRGRGPGEFSHPFSLINVVFDDINEILYFNHIDHRMGIQIETGAISTIKIKFKIEGHPLPMSNFATLDSTRYIGYLTNIKGTDSIKLIVFNKEGDILNTFRNYMKHNNYDPNVTPINPGGFYYFNNMVHFKERNNDTIFAVTGDSILPYKYIHAGNKQMPYQLPPNTGVVDFYMISVLGESDSFILFGYLDGIKSYRGYYDKKDRKTIVYEETDKDICCKYFFPDRHNRAGEFYTMLNASDIYDFVKANKNIETSQLLDIKEEDNPIILIGLPAN